MRRQAFFFFVCLIMTAAGFAAHASEVSSPFKYAGSIAPNDINGWTMDVADLDNDKDSDIVVGYQSGSIIVYENRGGSVVPRTISTAANGVNKVIAADIDRDGVKEIIATITGKNVVVWYDLTNTATLTYSARTVTSTEKSPSGLAVADMDRDGDQDIVICSMGGAVTWYENNGSATPTFTRRAIDSTFSGAGSLAVGDVNRDGAPDVVVASISQNKVMLYLNHGATFMKQLVTGALETPTAVGLADFDRDGNLDVYAYAWKGDEIDWFRNNGARPPSFTRHVITKTEGKVGGFVIDSGDVDRDGRIDLVNGSTWFRNKGGSPVKFDQYVHTPGGGPTALRLARYDSDVYPDLVFSAGWGLPVYKNYCLNPAQFRPAKWYPETGPRVSLATRLSIHDFTYYPLAKHNATQWQISKTPDFSSPIYNAITTKTLTYTIVPPGVLDLNTQYYWRVRCRFGSTNSLWSHTASFQTAQQPVRNATKSLTYPTIQKAIDAASPGDQIVVPAAVYAENVKIGKNLRVQSADPLNTATVKATIIDGNWTGSTIALAGNLGTTCSIAGFTIRNGAAYYGGGIYGRMCRATIENNIIAYNQSTGSKGAGGGISHCSGLIRNNSFQSNSAKSYNGAAIFYCQGVIRNNLITKHDGGAAVAGCVSAISIDHNRVVNNGNHYGAVASGFRQCINIHDNLISGSTGMALMNCYGVYNNEITNNAQGLIACADIHDNTIAGCTLGGLIECENIYGNLIIGNKGSNGGGLRGCKNIHDNLIADNEGSVVGGLYDCTNIYNNTIVNNKGVTAGGVWNGYMAPTTMTDCIVWGNTASGNVQVYGAQTEYSCIQGGLTDNHNINTDPLFRDAAAGDFRLLSTSPCIDAGKKTASLVDLLGVEHGIMVVGGRGDGSNYDMGAYEFAVKTPPPPVE